MVVILHTNDFHNKLTPAQAGRLREMKNAAAGSLLLDAGDAIWAGNVFFRPGGEPILKLMNDAGYDAMALGNREFHFLAAGLRRKIGWAEFPVLCANVRPAGGADLPVRSDITFERSGVRVVVFGLTAPMITKRMLSSKVSNYVFDDAIEAASRLVPKLRERADILVALTHIGLAADRQLASTVPGIDLIIGGHTHVILEKPEMVGRTAIVHSGWFARHVGRVEIEPGGCAHGRIISL
jgi:2',3'-cyclic-nucleotide 2'-phosphodiesterase (5'-nucleotidase family)